MTQSAEGTKESRARVSERSVFFVHGSFALRRDRLGCVRSSVRAYVPTLTVAHVPNLPVQSYFATYSELNNYCRAALN